MILGVIADDFTGATDVASMLVRQGLRAVVCTDLRDPLPQEADAVVVALKSRTAPVQQAVAESLAALTWLRQGAPRQIYFKYCSTFDSTAQGNIGPVAEALLDALGSPLAVACPALPENGRTVFQGHLFVGEQLLQESGMRHHPLTPMTDANLVRVLQAQCRGRVGLATHAVVRQGPDALGSHLAQLAAEGHRLVVVDAVDSTALDSLAGACADHPLVTAGSGLALALPAVYASRGWCQPHVDAAPLPPPRGQAAIVSGSCSQATQAQVAHWLAAGLPAWHLAPSALAAGGDLVAEAVRWAAAQGSAPTLFYATANPDEVRASQALLGPGAGARIEACLAQIAAALVEGGVNRLVVAGGETSGAVTQALGIRQLRIGGTIDPGVPWTRVESAPLWLALKSGNFGTVDFFAKALSISGGP
jgi:uncharacterized protein YgbK (DUF1537 family)